LNLKIGSIFPDFSLLDDQGNLFSLKNNFKTQYLLIYFYPKDETPGCTKQACYFRDYETEFKKLNCELIGISSDGEKSHENFKSKYNLPFKLLSDKSSKLRKQLNLPKDFLGLSPGRITFIINRKFQILFIFRSSFNMKSHISSSLKFLKNL
jgi:peroxiredoxin Q/BCP